MASPRVKICFLVDCTASMGPWIHQAKTKMSDMVGDIRSEHPNAIVQTAFVGYRDYGDQEKLIVHDFQDPQTLMRNIRNVEALGGDDQAEDVLNGLERALRSVEWANADVKCLIHIADAPAHGLWFHSIHLSDRYPRGDPSGVDPREYVERLSFLDVQYTFVRITDDTDKMVGVFHDVYNQGGSFRVIDLVPQDAGDPQNTEESLMTILSQNVSQSITRHISSQVP